MLTIKENFQIDFNIDIPANACFWDIECTGLSPKSANIYMIGCVKPTHDGWEATQFVAEDISEEASLIEAFEEYIKEFETLISFNGTRFDAPYVSVRASHLRMKTSVNEKKHLDLYLTGLKTKCLFTLEHYSQKSFERFFGLNREDKYDGGQLIPVYFDYLSTGSKEALDLVLLHNLEDIKGMLRVYQILDYVRLTTDSFHVSSIETNNDYITANADLPFTLFVPFEKQRDYGFVTVKENQIHLTLPVIKDTLNTYLKNYKDYVYVEAEDIIVLKTMADMMDKSSYVTCNRGNCKIKFEGEFVEIPYHVNTDSSTYTFRHERLEKRTFIRKEDITDDLLSSVISYILKH